MPQFLKDLGPLLWMARGGLLAVFVLHVVPGHDAGLAGQSGPAGSPTSTRRRSRRARRPSPCRGPAWSSWRSSCSTWPTSRSAGSRHDSGREPDHRHDGAGQLPDLVDAQGRHDVYSMVVAGFREPVRVASTYIVAMVILFVHLSHGIGSVFQIARAEHPADAAVRPVPVLAVAGADHAGERGIVAIVGPVRCRWTQFR